MPALNETVQYQHYNIFITSLFHFV